MHQLKTSSYRFFAGKNSNDWIGKIAIFYQKLKRKHVAYGIFWWSCRIVAEMVSATFPRKHRFKASCQEKKDSTKEKKPLKIKGLFHNTGGSGEIRTHEQCNPSLVFKTSAFNHSATLPDGSIIHKAQWLTNG